jgi:hypothetical protein
LSVPLAAGTIDAPIPVAYSVPNGVVAVPSGMVPETLGSMLVDAVRVVPETVVPEKLPPAKEVPVTEVPLIAPPV